jgi:Flp pilus assembly protein TadB
MRPDVAVFSFLGVGALALFGFLAVASWAGARSSERAAYYKNETLKKLTESSSEGANGALAYLREEQRLAAQRHREGLKVGGLVTTAVGMGLMAFLQALVHQRPIFLVGVIPLLIGIALLVYVFAMAPES